MSKFSNQEKAEAARREAGYRKHVYPRRVSDGKMRGDFARRQIELMEEIAEDYAKRDREDRPQLFGGP